MKKAIVIGANGYIGSAVVKKLLENDIEVLSISRRSESVFNPNSTHDSHTNLFLDLKQVDLLPDEISRHKWTVGSDCVFYNFAWSGSEKLMDGTIEDQLNNVTYISNSVKIASQLGCSKFINSGSIEESFAENYLVNSWNKDQFNSNNGNYAVSKIATRNMCKLLGYLNKIDYVHTRISAVVDVNLKNQGYISSVFKKILNNESYEEPINKQFFDIIDLDDLANAYFLLGVNGRNKVDYFIGSGIPQKLDDYFQIFNNYLKTGKFDNYKQYDHLKCFDCSDLKIDTGLDLTNSFQKVINKIKKS
jgi:nucleoside-diphosphate-sugar epimerase